MVGWCVPIASNPITTLVRVTSASFAVRLHFPQKCAGDYDDAEAARSSACPSEDRKQGFRGEPSLVRDEGHPEMLGQKRTRS